MFSSASNLMNGAHERNRDSFHGIMLRHMRKSPNSRQKTAEAVDNCKKIQPAGSSGMDFSDAIHSAA